MRASDESLSAVARRLGISVSGLRRWVAQAEIDDGRKPGAGIDLGSEVELTHLRYNKVFEGSISLPGYTSEVQTITVGRWGEASGHCGRPVAG